MRLHTAFLKGLTSPLLANHWTGRRPLTGSFIGFTELKEHVWRAALACALVTLLVVASTAQYLSLNGWSLVEGLLRGTIYASILVGLIVLWAILTNPMRAFLADCATLAELVSAPGMLGFDDLKSQAREILVLAAENVVIYERALGNSAAGHPETINSQHKHLRNEFDAKHDILRRFNLVEYKWDQYFDVARDRQRANTIRGA